MFLPRKIPLLPHANSAACVYQVISLHRRLQLVYFGTGETGTARKNCTDLFPFSEETMEAFNTRNSNRLKKALAEAEQYISDDNWLVLLCRPFISICLQTMKIKLAVRPNNLFIFNPFNWIFCQNLDTNYIWSAVFTIFVVWIYTWTWNESGMALLILTIS